MRVKKEAKFRRERERERERERGETEAKLGNYKKKNGSQKQRKAVYVTV